MRKQAQSVQAAPLHNRVSGSTHQEFIHQGWANSMLCPDHTCRGEQGLTSSEKVVSALHKGNLQILMFLSAEPLTRRLLSEEMSMLSTGSLWPYRDKKNLRLSVKKTLMVESSKATASSLPAGTAKFC